MTRAVAMEAAIRETDLYFALQRNDELASRGSMPIAKTAGFCAAKNDALRGHELGELWMGGEV